ncbi:MAG: hypothetical protein A3K26_08515 [Tenericutes bacterium RIFOXYA12_FULL_35_10]|nr:MAG: hypothetical protein A2012_07165 [Tenericutes bacterium GWE2_34_108]OHE36608.1 MAG: hypothetical protein A2Y46_03975 [Tenericutes bacterium GWF1_35_14]OHE37816.1 MAG: hypothetical protein A2Y44_05305 [Tenericutes bacterium GWF2_35_184]OHE45271.1 MAG: hypothetical protein A2221_07670 [Tenericutes bacterium RIFOXYA2_FULL_36_32]OHE45957.1 MAG: hypothetical protein A3K26_08515 [Tenericutes bacterium RIFOXYA12_FULL_35_10]OHE48723.1 MAG: hypothetical protein A2518_09150 [Tenericutes bacteriu
MTGLKKAKSHVEITFDEHMTILVESELVIKYHLYVSQQLEDETYQSFKDENDYLSTLRFALTKLKKMMTSKELSDLLKLQPVSERIQKKVLVYVIDKHYVDDLSYAKTYMMLKKYQEGPSMMKHRLKEKGISEEILNIIFSEYPAHQIARELVISKFKSMKKKTKRQAFQTIKMHLISKGFDQEVIEHALLKEQDTYQGDESKLLKDAYEKCLRMYQKKLTGYELEQKIKEKLYQKGFSYDMIKAYLEEKKLQSW